MNLKILLTGLTIIILSNILMLLSISLFNLRTFAAMFLFVVIALTVWAIFLKKDVPIEFKASSIEPFKHTILLLIVPLLAIAYFLNTSDNLKFGLLLLMFITSLATGIYEEIIFRGVALGSFISSGMKAGKAIFASALLFSMFHLYVALDYEILNVFLKMLNTFIMGVVLGYIYYETKNIFYVITIHFLWDFESFLAQSNVSDNIGASITMVLFAMSVLYFS